MVYFAIESNKNLIYEDSYTHKLDSNYRECEVKRKREREIEMQLFI